MRMSSIATLKILLLIAWKGQGSLEGKLIFRAFKYGKNSSKYKKENTILKMIEDLIRSFIT